jgi:hypothetical protein
MAKAKRRTGTGTGKKATALELALRVQAVYELRLMHFSYAEVAKYCKDMWNISSSATVAKYIRGAKEVYEQQTVPAEKEARRKQLARYQKLLKDAEKAGDRDLIVRICARIDKIQGLEVSRHEITGRDGGPLEVKDLGDDQVRARLAQLERELGLTRAHGEVPRIPVAPEAAKSKN